MHQIIDVRDRYVVNCYVLFVGHDLFPASHSKGNPEKGNRRVGAYVIYHELIKSQGICSALGLFLPLQKHVTFA